MGVIEDIRSGNKEAIKEVYKENVKDVYNFAKSITGDHDSALDATKKTFVILFSKIQKGEEPTNIRLAALKIAYDEACAIAMPSTDAIESPYDKKTDNDQEMIFKVNADVSAEKETAKAAAPSAEKTEAGPEKTAEKQSEPEKKAAVSAKSVKEETPERPDIRDNEDEDIFEDVKKTDDRFIDIPENDNKKKRKKKGKDYPDDERAKSAHPVASTILLIINIILVIILAWFILGLLQNLGIIPDSLNMGHNWFNNHIYPLF